MEELIEVAGSCRSSTTRGHDERVYVSTFGTESQYGETVSRLRLALEAWE